MEPRAYSRRTILKAGLGIGVGAASLTLPSLWAGVALAKPGGHAKMAHYCKSTIDITGLGTFELNIGGTGYAALVSPIEVDQALQAPAANLRWEMNQCFVKHPDLGLVKALLRDGPQSPLSIQSDSGIAPLFPAAVSTDLFFTIEIPQFGITLQNNQPFKFVGAADNLPGDTLDPGGEYDLQNPVSLYTAQGNALAGAMTDAHVSVVEHSGLSIDLVSWFVQDNQASVTWKITNLLPGPQEIMWYGEDAWYLNLTSPRQSEPFTIHDEPVEVSQIADITGPLDRYSCLFLGANSLSPEFAEFTSAFQMLDGADLKNYPVGGHARLEAPVKSANGSDFPWWLLSPALIPVAGGIGLLLLRKRLMRRFESSD